MAKYSKLAGEKVEKAMHEMHEGRLKSGNGKKVTSRKQAIAIGLSEAREEGAKVPKKAASKTKAASSKKNSSTATKKKTTSAKKKAPAKKTSKAKSKTSAKKSSRSSKS